MKLILTQQFSTHWDGRKMKRWWKKNLTNDLKISSPYNTYRNVGLPPTPISNPGLSSIMAVINPSKTNYLFYISDKSGHLHFAKTIVRAQRKYTKIRPLNTVHILRFNLQSNARKVE